MPTEFTKDDFENGLQRVFDRFDMVDDRMQKLESHVEKIELQNSEVKERVIRLETKHESVQNEIKEYKDTNRKEIDDIFKKLRSCKIDYENTITDKIQSENNKQNLKIISAAAGISTTICGLIGFVLKLAGAL